MRGDIPDSNTSGESDLAERTVEQGETRPADVAEQAERRPAVEQAETRPGLVDQAERR